MSGTKKVTVSKRDALYQKKLKKSSLSEKRAPSYVKKWFQEVIISNWLG